MPKRTEVENNSDNIRSVFEVLPGLHLLILADSPQFTIVSATNDFLKKAGRIKNEVIGKGYFETFFNSAHKENKDEEKALRTSFEHVHHTKETDSLKASIYNKKQGDNTSGKTFYSITNKAVLNNKGEVIYLLHSIERVIEKIPKKNEQEVMDIENLYGFFMEAPVAICIVKGANFVVQLANEIMLQFVGRTIDIVGKPIIESLPEAGLQGLMRLLNEVRHTGKPVHTANFPATILIDGVRQQFYFDLIFKPFFLNVDDAVPDSIFCVIHNVTKQILYQKKMEESEQDLRNLILQAPVGLCVMDAATLVSETANESFIEVAGKPHDAIVGIKYWDAFSEAGDFYKAALQGVIDNGKTFYANEVELLLIRHGKEEKIYATFVLEPMKNKEGMVKKVAVWVLENTTQVAARKVIEETVAQRTSELASAYEKLVKTNQDLARSNVTLEEFAYAASHDLKEPIRKISFFSDRLKTDLEDKLANNQVYLFDRLQLAVKRMGTLVDDLLTYSHVSQGIASMETIDLNKKVQLVLEDLELEIEEKKAIIDTSPLPSVTGHRRQLQQLFQNLIGNALKYSKPEIAPIVSIVYRQITGKEAKPDLMEIEREKEFHLIEITDNGIGFEQKDADRIFNVFTRLHGNNEYKGSGVGLSIVRKVVENHKGYIWAESIPGEGTTFKLLLPVS